MRSMGENLDRNKEGAIANGEIFYDTAQHQRWIVGAFIGIGDVGEMYEAALYNGYTTKSWDAVVQIELYGDGTPSIEIDFYLKYASSTDISNWKKSMGIPHLGVPVLLGSGSHQYKGHKYRFVVLQRYGIDLWTLFVKNGSQFPEHTVYKIALQIIPTLKYIHNRNYFHTDIEGANLLLDLNDDDHVYLVAFGSASHNTNLKKTYNGTIAYMSRDAHAGVLSARGDLESLLYNMIHWLCGTLPWEKNLNEPSLVQQQKEDAFKNTTAFLQECFESSEVPVPVNKFMQLLASMKSSRPKYHELSKILIEGLNELNHMPSGKLEFYVGSLNKSLKTNEFITSTWKLIAPSDTTDCKGADLNQDSVTKAVAEPIRESTKETVSYVDLTEDNEDSTQFESQLVRKKTGGNSCARTEPYSAHRKQTTEKAETCAIQAEEIPAEPISRDSEAQISETGTNALLTTAITDTLNIHPPDVDETSYRVSLQSGSKSFKRKSEGDDEVAPKCIKKDMQSTVASDKQLGEKRRDSIVEDIIEEVEFLETPQKSNDSGIVADNRSTSESSVSPSSFDENGTVTRRTRASIARQNNTPLHNAVKSKDIEEVIALLAKGAQINARNADHNTPIHLAFMQKSNKILDILLAAMESSSSFENVKNKLGLSTLHIACTRSNTTVIEHLLKMRTALKDSVSDKSPTYKGFTAMHFAARFKSIEAMKILALASSKSDREKKNSNDETPLQMISQQLENLQFMFNLLSLDTSTDPDVVKKFIDERAPVNAPVCKDVDYSQYATIHYAIERQNEDEVNLLIQKKADLTKTNAEGMTPLHKAVYIEEHGWQKPLVNSLYAATKKKEANPTDKNYMSYFHVACTRDDVVLLERLLDKNVDVNARVTYIDRPFYNFTPLHFAMLYETEATVEFLLAHGADVNACDGGHYGTPLHMAFEHGSKSLIDLLLKNGADAKALRPADKETTLSCLVYGYSPDKDVELLPYIEKLVVDFGVDVNARDHEGDTALHIACEKLNVHANFIKFLLEFGADINVESNVGETPFTWAIDKPNNWHCDNSDHFVMLYNHVQELKAFGLRVCETNERCCEQLMMQQAIWKIADLSDDHLALMEEKRLMEIYGMKNVEVAQGLSLYDFVMLEPEEFGSVDFTGVNLDDAAKVAEEYPIYGYLVRFQVRKVKLNPA